MSVMRNIFFLVAYGKKKGFRTFNTNSKTSPKDILIKFVEFLNYVCQ